MVLGGAGEVFGILLFMADLPIVCSLPERELGARRRGSLAQLVASASERRLLDDGASLTFSAPDEVLPLILEVVAAERECCRFLRFQLTFEADLGPLILEISGPPGTRQFLQETLGL